MASPPGREAAAPSRFAPVLERGILVRAGDHRRARRLHDRRAAEPGRLRLDHDADERRRILGRLARPRHPLRPRRDDLARPDVAADRRRLDGTRLSYATSLPFPLLLLAAGAVACVIGVLIGLPALRLSGLYLALITLMMAGAVIVTLTGDQLPERRPRLHRAHHPGRPLGPPARSGDPRWPSATRRTTATWSSSARSCSCSRCSTSRQAGPRLGVDPRERAGSACRRREHHALQDVGVRAGVVHGRRRGLPAGRAGRAADRAEPSRPRTR